MLPWSVIATAGMPSRSASREQLGDLRGTVEHRVLGVDMQVHERIAGHVILLETPPADDPTLAPGTVIRGQVAARRAGLVEDTAARSGRARLPGQAATIRPACRAIVTGTVQAAPTASPPPGAIVDKPGKPPLDELSTGMSKDRQVMRPASAGRRPDGGGDGRLAAGVGVRTAGPRSRATRFLHVPDALGLAEVVADRGRVGIDEGRAGRPCVGGEHGVQLQLDAAQVGDVAVGDRHRGEQPPLSGNMSG